jgi:acetolactate synthase-1/2/3 large subunit
MKDRLVLMDFITDQTENVYPMIAAGRPHNEMHLSTDTDRELA